MLEEVQLFLKELADANEVTEAEILKRLTFYQVKRTPGKPISEKQYKEIKTALSYTKDHFVCGYVDVPFYKTVLWKGFTTYDQEQTHVIETKGTIYLSIQPSKLSETVSSIIHYLIDQKIQTLGKVSLVHQNISLMLSFEEGTDAITVRNYIWEHLKDRLIPSNPFIPSYNGVGLITGESLPYAELISEYLMTYWNACHSANRMDFFTFDRFYKTLKQSYERNGADEPYYVHRVLIILAHLQSSK